MPVVTTRHMPSRTRYPHSAHRALTVLIALIVLAVPAGALGAKAPQLAKQPAQPGTLVQLPGARGCVADRSTPIKPCASARALQGPAPLLGSRAVALSPDGKNLYVAASDSDAIAIFARNARTGALTQRKGPAGCIAAKGAGGCAVALGLDGPNSLAVSPDGRNVYATSVRSAAVTTFRRNLATGTLSQASDGSGCISGQPIPGCVGGRALVGPDVIAISPDGANVYVGSFFGNAVAVFSRNKAGGALTQPAGASGCIATATSGCATGLALEAPEGMAISRDGKDVYVATALSEALVTLVRDTSTGTLSQATDGNGCIVTTPLAGCTQGTELNGADAVTVSPDNRTVYVTSLFSKSVTSFSRSSTGLLTQKPGTAGCLAFMRASGCSFGRALSAPEGLAVAPDGTNLYVASYAPGAIAVLDRAKQSGAVAQKPRQAGCVGAFPECSAAKAMSGLSSLVVSPDGRFVYAAAEKSNAVAIFRRTQ